MSTLKYRFVTPLLMWAIVIFGIFFSFAFVPPGELFQADIFGDVILSVALIYWLYMLLFALRTHPRAPRSVHAVQQVIDEGPYAIVRHPMYVSDILLMWCIFMWLPTYQILAIAIWLSAVLLFWSALEERFLEEKFLEEYSDYKLSVPMFLPRLRRHGKRPIPPRPPER
jgi:protein-S-isoprenylcysteine O-methyltransferase Ste14